MKFIRVIDVETGPDAIEGDSGIIEIGYTDVVPIRADLLGHPIDWIVVDGRAHLVDPGRPIPHDTMGVHNIHDADVRGMPPFRAVAPTVMCGGPIHAYAAHSAEFEQKLIGKEFFGETPWICTHKAALHLWPDALSHSNNALRYHLNPVGLDRSKAAPHHRAGPDSYVTAFILRDALNAGHSVETLIKWTNELALLPRCKVGDWRGPNGRGTPWADVDSGMLRWIVGKMADDPKRENEVHTARHHLAQREIDQRLDNERVDLNRQFHANGLPGIQPSYQVPPEIPAPPLSAYEDPLPL